MTSIQVFIIETAPDQVAVKVRLPRPNDASTDAERRLQVLLRSVLVTAVDQLNASSQSQPQHD